MRHLELIVYEKNKKEFFKKIIWRIIQKANLLLHEG